MGDRLRDAITPASDALAALAARLTELAGSPEPPAPRPVREDEVISLEDASLGTDPTDAARGLRLAAGPTGTLGRRVDRAI